MSHYTMPNKYGKCTRGLGAFLFLFQSSFLYFGHVFNKTIILLALVGYEMIIANSRLVGYLLSHTQRACCEEDLKENRHCGLHLARKYVGCLSSDIICSSKLRVFLELRCTPLGTDNVCGQTSYHIFAPNGDYCLFILGVASKSC